MRWIWLLVALFSSGCQSVAYYTQSIQGHLALMHSRQPVSRVLSDPRTDPQQREQLLVLQRIREFAGGELALPVKGQYDKLAVLDRPYVAWAVMAAPELSLEPQRWCYPVLGCLDYRGYFSMANARNFSEQLASRGQDTYVTPVEAYSTLGWFSDPVLDSFLRKPEAEMAELLFHELAHQKLFFAGDTVFNESFATAVAEEGLRRYAARFALDLGPYEKVRQRRREFVSLALGYRRQLDEMYRSDLSAHEKRRHKQQLMDGFRLDYAGLRERWGGYAAYDPWVRDVNNARLLSVAAYHELVPQFLAVLQRHDGDLPAFYRAMSALKKYSPARRREALQSGGRVGEE